MEQELTTQVKQAQQNSKAADALLRQYMPFIRSEASKIWQASPAEKDDGLSVAMFAFYEATMAYRADKGAFLPFAARAIRNRLIDFSRKEQRHRGLVSLDEPTGGEDDRSLLETLDTGHDPVKERTGRQATREEIADFSRTLAEYGLELGDIADNCPRQERTLAACRKALECAKADPSLLETLVTTKKLPLSRLAADSGVERKTLERHRKYIVALCLAYTTGFEIIRSHLKGVLLVKGECR